MFVTADNIADHQFFHRVRLDDRQCSLTHFLNFFHQSDWESKEIWKCIIGSRAGYLQPAPRASRGKSFGHVMGCNHSALSDNARYELCRCHVECWIPHFDVLGSDRMTAVNGNDFADRAL